MHFKEFLLSKTFRKHLLAALLLMVVLLWLTIQILSLYTHRGESMAVPDFSGMTMDQARLAAKKMSLRFELEDSIYRVDKKPGTILLQNPSAGHKIKSGRLIYLTLVSAVPGQEEVPKLTDISLRQAKVLLESKGFVLGKVAFTPSEFNDLVIEQKSNGLPLLPGSRLNAGSAIDLMVGQNMGSLETFVPDMKGLTISEVQILLESKQLLAGSVLFDASVTSKSDSMNARVITQSPQADSTFVVPAGTLINLVLSIPAQK